MQRAHTSGHRWRDATLARFRQLYWVTQGSKLAQSIKSKCQMCKLREAKFLEQQMGQLPEARLKPSPAFNHVMIDLFGPYSVHGVIFTDLVMRAVHIEAVFGYDTESFLMALSGFVSVRGWSEIIYSDPGSQLIGAERELTETWKSIDRQSLHKSGTENGLTWIFGPADSPWYQGTLHKSGTENGLTWIFGPADSPWYQGAVESLVKSAKRAIHFAINNQRLSVQAFMTVCSEATNLLNERPIGTLPSADSELNILTPNSLLLGRATAKNPGGWQPNCNNPGKRYHVVQIVTDEFWKKWTELYAPALVIRRKWNTANRNLRPGDVVIIADRNTLRGDYRLGIVQEVFPSQDGKVRRVNVMYKNFQIGENVQKYKGHNEAVIVSRSAQRLSLLVPVDMDQDQETKSEAKESV
ncbi:RNA-directed DNA polymerase from transposon X-element [Paramuricea clavata]|uniref:RNA-directed DNA polymerase from transposon X-element n=1 Tax=Paramuricea clavata TaxID=317549 RepID=A0A6S7HSA7_PARCT|nr:RNA-directed DNA polymerase from transposon X-element [Paramuricea clavata]